MKGKIEEILNKNILQTNNKRPALERWIATLNSLQPGNSNNNETVIISEDDWMDLDFVDDVREIHLGDRPFILLERTNENTIDPVYGINHQSYDEEPLTNNKSGAISRHGLTSLLSSCTPVGIFSCRHFFVAEIKGKWSRANLNKFILI